MRKTKEILRLKLELRRSHRETARAVGVSPGAVASVVTRAALAGLDKEAIGKLSEEELEEMLYPRVDPEVAGKKQRPLPNFGELHAERLKPGVTLELLHLEYREQHPDGYGYTQFCEHYRRWLKRRGLTMRQDHRAGDKLFVDYSGKKPRIVDRVTGEAVEVELFVAVLGASNYTYAEVTATQQVPDFVASHVRAFEFFGGVPACLVPDQLKSGVTKACRYEPEIQRTYEDLAQHYGAAVIPARPRKPRDKAKVEVGVQVVQRWILARMRKQTFFSLDEMNARIRELLDELNHRSMRRYQASRLELFERIDRPALQPLPSTPYTFATWSSWTVGSDYHVFVDGHWYSVPHRLVDESVDVRATGATIEVLHRGKRVAVHQRCQGREPGGRVTNPDHLPVAHRRHLEWTPERIREWAQEVGSSTAELVDAILRDRPHPEQGYRSCLAILRLHKRHGTERLERACARALGAGARSYRHVDSILRNGLDQLEPAAVATKTVAVHENVRGSSYYD